MMSFRKVEAWIAALLLCAGAIVATAATAQGSSPHAFLESIYKVYRSSNAKGIDYDKPDVARRYFTPALATAMIKDRAAAAKKDEVPQLNGDPFVDAQDWEIADLKLEVTSAGRKNAHRDLHQRHGAAPADARPGQDLGRLAGGGDPRA